MMSTMEDAVLAAAPCLISAGHQEILGEAFFKKTREKYSGSDLLSDLNVGDRDPLLSKLRCDGSITHF